MNQDISALAHQGFVLISQRNFDEGLKLLHEALEHKPDWPEVLLTIGHITQLKGDIEGGEPYFQKAMALEPNRPYTHAKLGRIAFWRGNMDEALAYYQATIKLSTAPPPVCFVDKFIEPLEQTLRSCYVLIFEILTDSDRFEEMETMVDEACARFPDAPEVHLAAGCSLIAAGETAKAAERFKLLTTIKDNPNLVADAWRHIVLCNWMDQALNSIVPKAADLYERGDKPPFVLGIAVWGDTYVSEFLETYLRSMSAPGNIPALAENFDVRIAVVTTDKGRQQIRESGIEEQLEGKASFDFLLMPGNMVSKVDHSSSTKFIYRTYIMANHVALAYAQAIGAGVSLSIPDGIIADGSYGHIGTLAGDEHIEAVFAQAPPVQEEGFLADIDRVRNEQNGTIHLDSRTLMGIAAQHMHPFVEQRIIGPSNKNFSESRSALFWWSKEGLLCHTFHWHPVYVAPKRLARYKKFRYVSIDGVLPQLLFPEADDWERIHLITDTDDFGFSGTIQADRQFPTTGKPFDINDYVAYFRESAQVRDIGRWLFMSPICFRGFVPQNLKESEMAYDPAIVERIAGLP